LVTSRKQVTTSPACQSLKPLQPIPHSTPAGRGKEAHEGAAAADTRALAAFETNRAGQQPGQAGAGRGGLRARGGGPGARVGATHPPTPPPHRP
jgi:hypothetical protein